MPTSPKTIAIIGAGGRGTMFAGMIRDLGHVAKVVAVAEPLDERRESLARDCGIPRDMAFATWEDFFARPRLCDAVIIATQDRQHAGPAVAALEKGYDVLLEKPMGATLEECRQIEAAQRKSGRILGVCHSLRYHKGFRKLKEIADSGLLGRLIGVDHLEQVAWWHQAHSFVRGNWGNSQRATFMLMAKSCHDLDYLGYLVGRPCVAVSSFGELTFFKRENAPAGSGERCLECPLEMGCEYSAVKHYVDGNRTGWLAATVALEHTRAAHLKAIAEGPYGRCVWKCDNDVVDHQVVLLQFADNVTATFTMTAFTQGGGRKIRVHGTKGEAEFTEETILVRTFADNNTQRISIGPETGGHGGGDDRVLREWLQALHTRDASGVVANAQESLKTHTIVFAAERARREGRIVRIEEM